MSSSEPTTTHGRPNSPIIVHHLNDSRSQRVLWLLEELELPYEVKKYQRTPERMAPKELLEVHPLGKSPVITDGDVTIAESGVIVREQALVLLLAGKEDMTLKIVEYLIKKYGNGHVLSEDRWLVVQYYTLYTEGSLQPVLVQRLMFRLIPTHMPFFLSPILRFVFGKIDALAFAPDLKKHGEMIEAHLLRTKGWITGGEEPTSADYMMVFALQMFMEGAPEYSGPAIRAYIQTAQNRPAYKRALERGGEFSLEVKV